MNSTDYLMIGLVIFLNLAFFIVPFTIIIRRMGFSGWWMLINLIPGGVLVGIWMMAIARWPAMEQKSN